MRQTAILLALLLALVLTGCADDASRDNDFLDLTAISITSEYDDTGRMADQTDNQFTATGDYSGEFDKDITTEVAWESSDPEILTINATGLATAIAPGTVMVSAASGDIENSVQFTVSDAMIDSLNVTPTIQDAPVGVERSFSVSGTFDDNTTQSLDRLATWTSSDETVAKISSEGIATGIAVGTASIQAEWQEESGTATLTVTEAVLTSLAITSDPPAEDYPVGLIVQYKLTGTYSDDSTEDLTSQAYWESDDTTNATVDNTAGEEGKVEMLASGNTDIIASYTDALTGDQKATTSLQVNSSTLREILIYATVYDADEEIDGEADRQIEAGETLDIYEDQSVQFNAKGEYSDDEEYDITTQATWSSSDTSIVTISNSEGFEGIATPGNETGEATINASFDSLEISFTLDVNQR